jgi:hypothetical protein
VLERVDAISAAARERLIDSILRTLSDRYVFPETAAHIEVAIREPVLDRPAQALEDRSRAIVCAVSRSILHPPLQDPRFEACWCDAACRCCPTPQVRMSRPAAS